MFDNYSKLHIDMLSYFEIFFTNNYENIFCMINEMNKVIQYFKEKIYKGLNSFPGIMMFVLPFSEVRETQAATKAVGL